MGSGWPCYVQYTRVGHAQPFLGLAIAIPQHEGSTVLLQSLFRNFFQKCCSATQILLLNNRIFSVIRSLKVRDFLVRFSQFFGIIK